MAIVISGYSGFIGKELSRCLRVDFEEVIGISLRDTDWKKRLGENTNILINLVGKAHDHQEKAAEDTYYHANFKLAKDLFLEFRNSPASLFIHVSSIAAVEELESASPLNEENTCSPASWYGKSKRAAEEWLLEQDLPPDKKLIVLRPPMVHGLGDKGNLGLLYKLISKGVPYPLAAFDNRRSFISIDNFCFFVKKIINQEGQIESGIYHIADDESVSTGDIIRIIKKCTEKQVLDIALPQFVVKGIARIGDLIPIPLNSKRLKKMTSDLLVSNAKIKEALGIQRLPLTAEEGLEKTIKSFGK